MSILHAASGRGIMDELVVFNRKSPTFGSKYGAFSVVKSIEFIQGNLLYCIDT